MVINTSVPVHLVVSNTCLEPPPSHIDLFFLTKQNRLAQNLSDTFGKKAIFDQASEDGSRGAKKAKKETATEIELRLVKEQMAEMKKTHKEEIASIRKERDEDRDKRRDVEHEKKLMFDILSNKFEEATGQEVVLSKLEKKWINN